ncbi:hypothetical protein PPERSA_10567 [Pseudocohnilembus persalinus]|uniref:Sphingomyelin synthase-like domain-containing protein n=1 Tax=Pseudocohnilembus persalinus TaxID=266149 RepID=A0A0V0Q981_PSEPJ|nr:hypothetical protein PPERSA_10567 [Pseudocohnilembus persalinus]|eukprot:KRW98796.1 hypothetical protein PPERSA_10567 [Pseudocohnilembus persalinus]
MPVKTLDVPCMIDQGHEVLDYVNNAVQNSETLAKMILIAQSLSVDIVCISSAAFWLFKGNSMRLPLAVILFYLIRMPNIYVFTPKFPEGFFFEYPGFPSFCVPYGRSSDFFFSGHTGIMVIMVLEWRKLGYHKMKVFSSILLCYVMFSLLTIRIHYTVDVTIGLFFAHYMFIISEYLELKLNLKCIQYQESIQAIINKYRQKNIEK